MQKPLQNYAFIDSQNLNLGVRDLGWKLDYIKFRIYLKEKYGVKIAYLFIGYTVQNQDLYNSLQKAGYVLIFKPTIKDGAGKLKGNVDADLVLQSMIDYSNYAKAVIVSSDGDFYCLAKYLEQNKKLERVISPSQAGCSVLLQQASKGNIDFLNGLKRKLEYLHHS